MFRVRHSEAVRQVRHFPTQLRKMAKCMIYIGTYAWGKCYGKCLTCLTASPRRPRPLDGSVINGTIQQLLDTPRAEPVTTNLAGDATQRHTAAQRGFIHEDAARPPLRRRAPSNPHYQVESAQPIFYGLKTLCRFNHCPNKRVI